MKIAIFGTGNFYSIYKKWFVNVEITAFLDNDKRKQGKLLDGVPILSPNDVLSLSVDRIYIMSHYIQEMPMQLKRIGVEEEKIFYIFDLAELGLNINCMESINDISDSEKIRILLIANDLNLSGAQYALLYAAQILKKSGYDVLVGSPVHGKLEKYFAEADIPIIFDERIITGKFTDLPWLKKFQLVFFNTTAYYHLLLKRDRKKPMILWTHEPDMFFKYYAVKKLEQIDTENLYVLAASNVAKQALLKYNSNFKIDLFPIGLPAVPYLSEKKNTEKFVFLVVGEISNIKGQDIVAEAAKLLSEREKKNMEIRFVGRIDRNCDISFLDTALKSGIVKVRGELDKEKVYMEYAQCDVLICASRADVLPTVVIEAMQHKVMSIVSDAAGISEYLTDGENTLIFPSENVEVLVEKIRWCLNNRTLVKKMGEQSYKIYEKFFTMEAFERNLLSVVKEALH